MADKRVEPIRTLPTVYDYARAVLGAWGDTPLPSKEAVGVLWAQYMVETGGRHCYNWNIGNVKWTPGCGYDYHCLKGTWECVTQSVADSLVTSGVATLDDSASHKKSCGPNKVSVLFQPPHPSTRFRAYDSLSQAMERHLKLLRKRFSKSWVALESGDPMTFAKALHAQRYFTADPAQYAALMQRHFKVWMGTPAYEDALRDLVPTPPAVPESEPVVEDEPIAIIHPSIPLYRSDGSLIGGSGEDDDSA